MPTGTFTWTLVQPAGGVGNNNGTTTGNIIIETTCPADPANPGNLLVPTLTAIRQSGSSLIDTYDNVDVVKDSNGDIPDTSLLTGGYFVLRQYQALSGVNQNFTAPIACIVAFASGYAGTAGNLATNNGKIRLEFDPQVTLNPNLPQVQPIIANSMPATSVTPATSGGGGGGGGS